MAFVRTVKAGQKCTKQMGYNGFDNNGQWGFIATTPAYPCDRAPSHWRKFPEQVVSANNVKGEAGGNSLNVDLIDADGRRQPLKTQKMGVDPNSTPNANPDAEENTSGGCSCGGQCSDCKKKKVLKGLGIGALVIGGIYLAGKYVFKIW